MLRGLRLCTSRESLQEELLRQRHRRSGCIMWSTKQHCMVRARQQHRDHRAPLGKAVAAGRRDHRVHLVRRDPLGPSPRVCPEAVEVLEAAQPPGWTLDCWTDHSRTAVMLQPGECGR